MTPRVVAEAVETAVERRMRVVVQRRSDSIFARKNMSAKWVLLFYRKRGLWRGLACDVRVEDAQCAVMRILARVERQIQLFSLEEERERR